MMNSALISLQNISKRFGRVGVAVLHDVSLQICRGEIFGLLGINGAGKTTLLRCLLGLLKANSGKITFLGKPLSNSDILEHFGFLPESFQPYGNLTGAEFLGILAGGLNIKASGADSLLEQVGLSGQRHKCIRAYSRGMIQRLGLAICVLKDPGVVILDEPTLGLDPLGQHQILDLLVKLNQSGKTIFFSSHILSQVERVCHRIGIIHSGRIIFEGTCAELLNKQGCVSLEEAFLKEIGSAGICGE